MILPQNQKTVYIIDGSSFLYRSYYALKPLTAPDGQHVQAVFGFARMIKKMAKELQPHYCVLVWDSKGPTVRHNIYTDYKTQRQAPPSDMFTQKALIEQFAELIGLHQVAMAGVEADDLMASIAQDCSKLGYTSVIITSDKDMRQAVTESIVILDPFKEEILDIAALEKKYPFHRSKLPFYFGLVGDTADNIPGVRGIGPKGAEKLVQQFESMEDLYANIDSISNERTKNLLLEGKEMAFLSEKLFYLHYYPTGKTPEDFVFDPNNFIKAASLFEQLNFKSLLKEIGFTPTEQPKEPFAQRYGYTFITVTQLEQLDHVCKEIERAGVVAIDTETNSVNPLESTAIGTSLCCKEGTAYYIPLAHATQEQQLPRDITLQKIKPLLENQTIQKYMHHAKFDMEVLHHAGINVQGPVFDTLIAAGLVQQENDRLSLKSLSEKYFSEVMTTYKEVVTDSGYKDFSQVPLAPATDYAAADTHQTFKLVTVLQQKLKEQEQERLFYDMELPLLFVLYDMELEGIALNTHVLAETDKRVSHHLDLLRKEIAAIIGPEAETLNLNSSRQIGVLLFEKLGLTPVKKTTKKTAYSTDQEVLKALEKEHPVAGYILRYRELYKLKSTYIDALPTFVNPQTGHIHTNFKQTATATGRLASTDPNLQNIPTDDAEISIRAAFQADPGHLLISADYSQMELRVLAHLSGDPNLCKAFLEDQDIHTYTAAAIFEVPLEAVTTPQRQLAKRINFSILYGLTSHSLARDLNISHAQAREFMQRYKTNYAHMQDWMDAVVQETEQLGYVTTWYGRRRYLPDINEKNHTLREQARRIAINTKVQGSAAEIIKLGMIQLHERLKKEIPSAKILLQIHDELILTAPEADTQKTCALVQQTLQNVVQWQVPLVVNISHGKTWQDVSK